jgi:hypothetical protein
MLYTAYIDLHGAPMLMGSRAIAPHAHALRRHWHRNWEKGKVYRAFAQFYTHYTYFKTLHYNIVVILKKNHINTKKIIQLFIDCPF